MSEWTDRLRALWDFDDLDGTEARLRTQLSAEESAAGRAEVTAELARVHGLRGSFEEGDALLDEAHALGGGLPAVDARIDLERGRLRRSSGDPEAARPLFESAYSSALESEQHFLAADAAHMVALVAGDRDGFVEWTQRGIELAERHEPASYWRGPLLNNLGWEYYDAGDFAAALDAFERALGARAEDDPANAPGDRDRAVSPSERRSAPSAAPTKRSRSSSRPSPGRRRRNAPDGWFHEELAEEYAAVGRAADARAHARRSQSRCSSATTRRSPRDAERSARLAALAAA